MSDLWRRLRSAFENLSLRERILVSSVGVLTFATIFYFGVIQTTLSVRRTAQQRAISAEQQLQVMAGLRREYEDVHDRLTAVEKRIQEGKRGNLRTTLENLAQASLVKVESMEPQATPSNDRYRETKVEVTLKQVTLAQTVSYLHQIENNEQLLSVKSLRMKTRKDDPAFLDVTFTVSSFEPL